MNDVRLGTIVWHCIKIAVFKSFIPSSLAFTRVIYVQTNPACNVTQTTYKPLFNNNNIEMAPTFIENNPKIKVITIGDKATLHE